ncbi:MAG: hypothetical protein D6675_04145 [Gemmatimonadetes bacterium]|nr:MAG: hypothetical protein D6675_04145 [Gemmatimonadota bacterium]
MPHDIPIKKPMERENLATIRKKYPNQWLLLADYDTDDVTSLVSGIVVSNSKNRATTYTKQMRTKRKLCIDYTGDIPDDLVVIF